MRNISIKQILILLLISFFFFGDFFSIKKKLQKLVKRTTHFLFKYNRKKGN